MRAVVIGAGLSGRSQIAALRHFDVTVAGLSARDAVRLEQVARELAVPEWSPDWSGLMERLKPDIVVLACPAGLRRPVIEQAAAQGCHIVCDKPLALNAYDGWDFAVIANKAGIKTAYGATRWYEPTARWVRHTLEQMWKPSFVEFTTMTTMRGTVPYGWWTEVDRGGGLLNNHLPHILALGEQMLGEDIIDAEGYAWQGPHKAPRIDGFHYYSDVQADLDNYSEADFAQADWYPCHYDCEYHGVFSFPSGAFLRVEHSLSDPQWFFTSPDGESLVAQGELQTRLYEYEKALPMPDNFAALPPVGTPMENRYGALIRDLLADLNGRPHGRYLTFMDGARHAAAIQAIRTGKKWQATA